MDPAPCTTDDIMRIPLSGISFHHTLILFKLETSHELLQGFRDLTIEAIITEVKPRLLWLQLEGL